MTDTIEGGTPKPRRAPILVVFAFNVALLLSPLAAMLSIATYVPRAQAGGLAAAAGLALASLTLLALIWRRLPRPIRAFGGGIVLLSGFALWSVTSRCL